MKPVQDNIMDALCRFPHGLSTDGLIEQVYRGAKEPDYARESIYVAVHRLRKSLRGVEIRGIRKSGWRYQLWFK